MTDDAYQGKARALFEAQVAATDAATRAALRARRLAALARTEIRFRSRWWMPAGGIATAALALALVLPRGAPDPPVADVGFDAAADSAGAALELEHDADFYTWLAEAPADFDDTAPPNAGPDDGWMP